MLMYLPTGKNIVSIDKNSNAKVSLIVDLLSGIKHVTNIDPIVDFNNDKVYYEITLDNDQVAEVYHDFNVFKLDAVGFLMVRDEFYFNVQEILKSYV